MEIIFTPKLQVLFDLGLEQFTEHKLLLFLQLVCSLDIFC